MKPEKLERNHERLKLKEQRREQREKERVGKHVARYADVSSAALVARHDEAYAKASLVLTLFTVSFCACLISLAALAVLSLFAEHLPLLTSTLKVIAVVSAPVAAIAWIIDARLYKEMDQLNDVIMWRNEARYGSRGSAGPDGRLKGKAPARDTD